MYALLGEMIESAEKGDKERAIQLSRVYDILNRKGLFSQPPGDYSPSWTPDEVDSLYDQCRQAAVMSVKSLEFCNALVADARERYARIPKPTED